MSKFGIHFFVERMVKVCCVLQMSHLNECGLCVFVFLHRIVFSVSSDTEVKYVNWTELLY